LGLEPLRQLGEGLVAVGLRLEVEQLARERDVGEAVADVAGAVRAGDLGGDVLAENVCEGSCDLEDGGAPAARDAPPPPPAAAVWGESACDW